MVGHALGAVVMLEYASIFPERVRRLMAVSLPMRAECINEKLLASSNNSVMSKMLWWRQQAVHKEVEKETEKTQPIAISTSLESVKSIEEEIDTFSRVQNLGQKGAIFLAVYGEKDEVIDPTPTRDLDNRWPNIRPIGLSESKHFPMLDEASKFQRLLKDFLEVESDLSALELKEEWRRRTR
jgi:pimeloyl-ACP methyl ester carboxylesterase